MTALQTDLKKMPFGLQSAASNRSNKSSCNEEKMTQRGSLPEKQSNTNEQRSPGPSSDTKDDLQYEKHKIWRQSQIENEVEVRQHESVFHQSGLNMMTFIEADCEPQLNQFDPIKSSARP